MRPLKPNQGQSLVEMAIIIPVIIILMLGATDMGRAFYLNIEISGASRSGMRAGVIGQAVDIGTAVRGEPNNAIANDVATWGDTGPGQLNDCDPKAAGHNCGDLSGCPPTAFSGSRSACFAVRTCTLNSGICTFGQWGSRPTQDPGAQFAIQIRVVYKLVPVTPAVASLAAGTNGIFYLTSETIGTEMY